MYDGATKEEGARPGVHDYLTFQREGAGLP